MIGDADLANVVQGRGKQKGFGVLVIHPKLDGNAVTVFSNPCTVSPGVTISKVHQGNQG